MIGAVLEFPDNQFLRDLCGIQNRNLAAVEAALDVTISQQGGVLRIIGDDDAIANAKTALTTLYDRIAAGGSADQGTVDGVLRLLKQPDNIQKSTKITIRTVKRSVEPRTPGQVAYIESLLANDLVFGVGAAGTGKTYLAVAVGVSLFLEGQVDKIILSRPAVEAGERLGFLPGDMKEKIDPYLRPLYDAIHDLWASVRVEKLIEEGRIEVAPLAFMRGRTLSNAFVVLDEAQNTTAMQMRMFLTRLGENSRMVVTGDPSQIDLPRGVGSGLLEALEVLKGVKGVGIERLTDRDVVRHPLVARIVEAYAQEDAPYPYGALR
jgi:phosphate starvation-inducible PhoH-like protein